jgi:ribonuclease HI
LLTSWAQTLSRQFPSTNKDTKRQKWQLRFSDLDFLLWQQQQSTPILFFDGASAGNPGATGAGGVIFDSDGQNILDYSWGLGKTTNNRAESLAVYMGLQIASSRNLHELTVLGDSELIIKDLLGLKNSTLQIPNGLQSRINSLKFQFSNIHFFHILRSQNQVVDSLAKLAKNLEQSQLYINQDETHVWIP